MSKALVPACFFIGHRIVWVEDKPGWFKIDCGRCGRDVHSRWFNRTRNIPYKIERGLVWLANRLAKIREDYPGYHYPKYRAIDQQIVGIGTKHSCAAYSYEHIVSMIKQYEGDGLPKPLLESLISEEGWIDLEEHPEEIQPMLDDIRRGVTLLQTKQEQEELNK